MWSVINRFLSKKNSRSLTVLERGITDCPVWTRSTETLRCLALEPQMIASVFFSSSFKLELLCCHPCFYISTTPLNCLNSSKGCCRVWLENVIQFSIVSRQHPANTMLLLYDSAKLSGVKREEDRAQNRALRHATVGSVSKVRTKHWWAALEMPTSSHSCVRRILWSMVFNAALRYNISVPYTCMPCLLQRTQFYTTWGLIWGRKKKFQRHIMRRWMHL